MNADTIVSYGTTTKSQTEPRFWVPVQDGNMVRSYNVKGQCISSEDLRGRISRFSKTYTGLTSVVVTTAGGVQRTVWRDSDPDTIEL